MRNIIVQTADDEWTLKAVHLAAALARDSHAQMTLLHLVLAQNPGLLGDGVGVHMPTWKDHQKFEEYATICENYGVRCQLQLMQYVTLIGALKEAVSCLEADALFIKSPHYRIELWQKLNVWWMKRCLESPDCILYLVDEKTSAIQDRPRKLSSAQTMEDSNIPHHV